MQFCDKKIARRFLADCVRDSGDKLRELVAKILKPIKTVMSIRANRIRIS